MSIPYFCDVVISNRKLVWRDMPSFSSSFVYEMHVLSQLITAATRKQIMYFRVDSVTISNYCKFLSDDETGTKCNHLQFVF